MTKSILISLGFTSKFVRFSQEYKTRNVSKENINNNFEMEDSEVSKF